MNKIAMIIILAAGMLAAGCVPALKSVHVGYYTGVCSFGHGPKYAVTIKGVIPGGKQPGDILRIDCLNDDGSVLATMDATRYITASDDTTLYFGTGLDNDTPKPDNDWLNKRAKITLVRDGAEYSLTCEWWAVAVN